MNRVRAFIELEINPVLKEIDLHSPSAEFLLTMIACHESMGLKYRKQINGPALSYFQMEPATLDDLVDNYLRYRPDLMSKLMSYRKYDDIYDDLEFNDKFAVAAARYQIKRDKEPLPECNDIWGMALYAKRVWNTELGQATVYDYVDDFFRYAPVPVPMSWF